MTSSNGNVSALLSISAGNSPVTGEFPTQRPVTRNFDVFFDLRLNKRFSKQSSGWWFATPLCPLWRRCNARSRRSREDLSVPGNSQIRLHYTPRTISLTCMCHCFTLGHMGAVSIRKTVLPGMAIPMLKIRRPNGRLIFNMEIAIRR